MFWAGVTLGDVIAKPLSGLFCLSVVMKQCGMPIFLTQSRKDAKRRFSLSSSLRAFASLRDNIYTLAGLFKRDADVQCYLIRDHGNGIAYAKCAAFNDGCGVKAGGGFLVERVIAGP